MARRQSAVMTMQQTAAERGLTPIITPTDTRPAYYHARDVAEKFGLSESKLRRKARELGAYSAIGRTMILSATDMVLILPHVRPSRLVKPRLRRKVVYFLRCGDYIKIGYSNDFKRRLAAIQAITPYEVTVIATVAGTMAMERELHRQFASLRHRMEWFRHEGELAEYVATLSGRVDA